jgi:hypothetical protein
MVEVHDSERGWMCYNKWMYFFGFVVRLPAEMPGTLAGLPVSYPGGADIFESDAPLCVTVRSSEDICEYVTRYDGGILGSLADKFLSSWAPDLRTPEYAVVQVCGGWQAMREKTGCEEQALLDLLESPESPMELIGALYVTAYQYGEPGGLDFSLYDESPESRAAIIAEYGVRDDLPLDEQYALAERLRTDPRIENACVCWIFWESAAAEDGALAILPVFDFGTGDLDENGTANIGDAVLLARYLAEDSAITQPTPNGKNLADMDGDGTLDSSDLAALLEMLANPS